MRKLSYETDRQVVIVIFSKHFILAVDLFFMPYYYFLKIYLFYFLVFALFIHSFLWLAQPALGAGLVQHVVPGIEPWSPPPKLS